MTEESRKSKTDESAVDTFFGFLVGLYVASLVAPAVGIAVALRVTTDPGMLFFTLLGGGSVTTAVVGFVARRESLAVGLGRSRWVWLLAFAPLAYFVALFGSGESEAIPDALAALPGEVVGLSMVGMLAGMVTGLGLSAAAQNRHAKARQSGAEELARFSAPAPERDRRIAKWAMAGLVVAGLAGFGASIVLDFEPLRWTFQMLVPIGAALYGSTTEREVVVTDAGLVVGTPAYRRFRPWSAFENYSVSSEAIVIRRSGLSLGGLWDVRRDATEVDEVGEVETALDRVLPRH